MVAGDVVVAVPASLVFHATTINLNEPHAALHHTAGRKALGGDVFAFVVVQPVHGANVLRFLIHRQRLGRGALHAVGQLEALNTRGQRFLKRINFEVLLVQRLQEIKLPPLLLGVHAGGAFEIIDRIACGPEVSALIDARQKARAPVSRMSLRQATSLRVAHHHKRRQAVALASQPVCDP